MKIEKIMKDKNIKLTAARKHILEILKNATQPLSYENVKADISMDKATFYRNILKFEEVNILNSFELNDKKRYFELKKEPHAHFACILCNKIECIENIDIQIDGHEINNVIVNGKCTNCLYATKNA